MSDTKSKHLTKARDSTEDSTAQTKAFAVLLENAYSKGAKDALTTISTALAPFIERLAKIRESITPSDGTTFLNVIPSGEAAPPVTLLSNDRTICLLKEAIFSSLAATTTSRDGTTQAVYGSALLELVTSLSETVASAHAAAIATKVSYHEHEMTLDEQYGDKKQKLEAEFAKRFKNLESLKEQLEKNYATRAKHAEQGFLDARKSLLAQVLSVLEKLQALERKSGIALVQLEETSARLCDVVKPLKGINDVLLADPRKVLGVEVAEPSCESTEEIFTILTELISDPKGATGTSDAAAASETKYKSFDALAIDSIKMKFDLAAPKLELSPALTEDEVKELEARATDAQRKTDAAIEFLKQIKIDTTEANSKRDKAVREAREAEATVSELKKQVVEAKKNASPEDRLQVSSSDNEATADTQKRPIPAASSTISASLEKGFHLVTLNDATAPIQSDGSRRIELRSDLELSVGEFDFNTSAGLVRIKHLDVPGRGSSVWTYTGRNASIGPKGAEIRIEGSGTTRKVSLYVISAVLSTKTINLGIKIEGDEVKSLEVGSQVDMAPVTKLIEDIKHPFELIAISLEANNVDKKKVDQICFSVPDGSTYETVRNALVTNLTALIDVAANKIPTLRSDYTSQAENLRSSSDSESFARTYRDVLKSVANVLFETTLIDEDEKNAVNAL